MSVSIIIPAYQAAGIIHRALDSLLAQTLRADEILVIDDGSADDLQGALLPYQAHVKLLRKRNGGAASARNVGIEHCQGDWVAFIDADDYWEPVKLERQLETSRRHPEVGLISCDNYVELPGQKRSSSAAKPAWMLDRVLRASGADVIHVATQVWTSAVLVRRDLLGKCRFDERLATAEDRDLWIRLAACCPVYLLSDKLATLVAVPNSLSRTAALIDRDCANMLHVLRQHSFLLGQRGLKQWEAKVFREWAGRQLGERRPDAAVAPAWNRLWRQPFSPEAWWILGKSLVGAARLRWQALHRWPLSR